MKKGFKVSEETKRKISNTLKGRKPYEMSEDTKRKMSFSQRRKHLSEEHKKRIADAMKGKLHSEEVKKRMSIAKKGKSQKPLSERTKRKLSKALKGRPLTEDHKKKISEVMKGRFLSGETKRKMSLFHKGKFGDKSPNWRGGISFFPYPLTFNRELKQFIRDRDNNECQNPFCNRLLKKLTVHHIDHNKDNCSQFNLITLCNSCNGRANGKYRWERLYKKIIWSKYE